MLRYAARRLLYVPLSILIVVFTTFFILRLTGNPIDLYLDINRTPEQEAFLTQKLGLDRPIIIQFLVYLGNALTGDFGTSLQFGGPALDPVLGRLGATIQLAGIGLVLSMIVGALGGIVCALYKDRIPDFTISSLALASQSMPSFWLGLILIQIFVLQLGWLPSSGTGHWTHFILPGLTVMSFVLPNFVMVTRASVLEVLDEQFTVTARAKGLSRGRILLWHVIPNALNPILSLTGLQVGRLMGGSIITETIFAWPGVGRLMIGAIFQRDVPVVIASVFIVSLVIIIANLVVDIFLSIVDPRIALE